MPNGARVVTPNSLAAQRLEAPAFRPATLETLARQQLAAAGLGVAPAIASHRALLAAADDVFPVGTVPGLASALAPAIRSLFRAGADFDALLSSDSPRVRRLATLAIAYRARLRAQGLIDGAESLTEATRLGPGREVLLVAGYPRLGTDERAFLDAVAGPGSEVYLPIGDLDAFAENDATAVAFAAWGWDVVRPQAIVAQPVANRAAAHAFASREDEVRHALATIKGLLADGVPPSDIALVVRDDADYGPLALAVAWEFQVPLRALYAVPLTETRLGVWLEQVLVAAEEGLRYEPTFRALDHVLGPQLGAEAWGAARKTRPAGADAWGAIGVDVGPLVWPEAASRGAWVDRLRALLQGWGVRRKAAQWPRELHAVSTLLESLDSLAEPVDEALTREAFADALREALRLLTAPAQPGRGGVALHTPFALYGARYPHVFVLGLAEGVMPTPVANDPALDFHERRLLAAHGVQLEDAVGAARRERLSFLALLEAAPEALTLSYARQQGGKELGPSAYFGELGLTFTAPATPPVASAEVARRSWAASAEGVADALTPRIRHALAVERGREGDQAPDQYDGVVGVPLDTSERVFSATQLTALGQCPFKWFSGYALKLRVPDEADEELTPSVRGTLFHKVLELAAKDVVGEADPRQAMLDVLEASFRAAEVELELPALPSWPERRLEYLRTLRQAITAPDFLADDAVIHALEAPFEGTWHGLKLKGLVDRVDRHPDGALSFVDYKTSGSKPKGAKDDRGKPTVDVQLPLYIAVAAPALEPGAAVRRAYYYSLTKAKTIGKAEAPDPALDALAAEIKRRMAEGDFPVDPDVDEAACTFCDHAMVCRRGPRLARKALASLNAPQEAAE